jgi:hypothetical protein
MESPADKKEDRGRQAFLGDAIGAFLKDSGLGPKMREWKVYDAWREVLGPELGKRARAVAFRRGELVVEVESAAHLQELKTFTGEAYRIAANRSLGSERIRVVAFKLKR